ncbi:MAG: Mth938-like domain-containing protein [Candidatus Marinimicrobia bacterium]|nr:Mth938-like domain-containing protein [Candidatus Neomarinimicrobiota bacterium]
MRIDSYKFGEIIIEGVKYNHDVIIFPDKVKSNWWRKNGHNLCDEDIKEILDYKPDVLIIGKGKYGIMRVPDELIKKLKGMGIDVIVANTDKAVVLYNESKVEEKVGAFHLTC